MRSAPQWVFGPFRLDSEHACLWREGEAVALTPKAFAVLHYLVTHPDRLVAKDELLDAVWPEIAVSDAVVRVAIGALRKILDDPAPAPRYIATVPRRGYRFVAPVVEDIGVRASPTTSVMPVPPRTPAVEPWDAPATQLPEILTVSPQPSGASLPGALPLPQAEHRPLTVLFCDLVDSTRLAGHLDPEDYREIVRAYHQTCADVMQRFEGYLAQYLGDGVLVYFGYPMAHEDDAQRAVWAGLGILAAIDPLNSRLALPPEDRVAVRLGVHTGVVVVGNVGMGERQEPLALGEMPHLAVRLQHVAAPNTLVISAATHQLVAGYFRCTALGAHALPGLAQPLRVYRVLGASGVQSRLEVAALHGLTPLVGREPEIALLRERWTRVKAGMGQVVVLAGEAGIGKSRLVQVLKDHISQEPHVCWEWRSVPYDQHTALFPVTEWLQRLLQWQPEERVEEKLGKLERILSQYRLPIQESVRLLAPLLALPLPAPHYPPLSLSPQRQRQKTLEVIVTILQEHAERQPVLFIVEDVHWADPSTLELLHLVIDQSPTSSMLTVLTCRPHGHPAWPQRSYLTEIRVNRLSQAQAAQMVTSMTEGTPVPAAVLQQMLTKTDGVPLFIEEVIKAMVESGHLQDVHGHDALGEAFSTLTIPATLQDALMARLDRLGTAKAVAQYAAVLGRQFAYALLQAVAPLDAATLQRELGRLVAAELVYQRGLPPHASYLFKHALIQEAAYASLLKRTRQHYHQRIAHILEEQFPETTGTHPELVAHHATAAGLTAQAVHYWHTAAQRAVERSAHVEAIAHLQHGLALLETLPETPECTQQKAKMLLALGASLMATQGYAAPEVEQTYLRAHHLCQHLDDPHQLFPVLHGLHSYYNVRAELQTAHTLGGQLLTLAQQAQAPAMLVMAHRTLGATLSQMGAIAPAHTHFAQGIALYDAQQHRASTFLYGEDAGVICHSLAARTLWLLGYPDQARTQNDEAVTLAHQSAHPFSLSYVLSAAALFHQLCRGVRCTQACAEAVIKLAKEQGFPHRIAHGALLCGWALVQQGQAQAGIEQIHLGLTTYRATGAELSRPYALALLAEAHGTLGQPEAGLTVLNEALRLTNITGARWPEPELHRLKGELLLQQSVHNHTEAESCFHHAMAIAQHQHAKSLELRAATSLARLWQCQGKRDEARQVLGDVYRWFTEGFDTADVQDAKGVLEA
jgi:class 3 adenylate cyclase/DNA-binding winged helix-turn-helix (wHTH) protein/predicted ATPase